MVMKMVSKSKVSSKAISGNEILLPLHLKLGGNNILYISRILPIPLISGGYLTALFGQAEAGKTLIAINLAIEFTKKTGYEVLYIDTEGTVRPSFIFRSLFAGSESEIDSLSKVHLVTKPTLKDFLGYLGIDCDLEFKTSDSDGSGKWEVRKMSFLSESATPIERFLKENKKVKLLIVDSISDPVKKTIPARQQDYPARSTLLYSLFGKLTQIVHKYGLIGVTTHHASKAPITGAIPRIYGGSAVKHNHKFFIYIDHNKKYRMFRLFLYRQPPESPYRGMNEGDIIVTFVVDESGNIVIREIHKEVVKFVQACQKYILQTKSK